MSRYNLCLADLQRRTEKERDDGDEGQRGGRNGVWRNWKTVKGRGNQEAMARETRGTYTEREDEKKGMIEMRMERRKME